MAACLAPPRSPSARHATDPRGIAAAHVRHAWVTFLALAAACACIDSRWDARGLGWTIAATLTATAATGAAGAATTSPGRV